jgi:sugar phosphate isomerase/epimerase
MPECKKSGIVLAVENHDRFSAKQLAELVQGVRGPWIGICLDTVNSFGALEAPEVVVETLAPWVVNLHVKDFSVCRATHNLGFVIEGRPAGQGRLDLPWLLGQLQEAGRDVNAIVELWTPPEPEIAATIAKEENWARQSIAYLRTLIPD